MQQLAPDPRLHVSGAQQSGCLTVVFDVVVNHNDDTVSQGISRIGKLEEQPPGGSLSRTRVHSELQ